MTYADFIRYQIESKANVILSVTLKIDKVSTAELPLANKYLLRVYSGDTKMKPLL